MADDAVSYEPVSAPNSLLTSARIQELTFEFPTQRNREFLNAYQGIFFEEQGILIAGAAKPAALQTLGLVAATHAPINRADRVRRVKRTFNAQVQATKKCQLSICLMKSPQIGAIRSPWKSETWGNGTTLNSLDHSSDVTTGS